MLRRLPGPVWWPGGLLAAVIALNVSAAGRQGTPRGIERWGLFEAAFASTRAYDNPLQEAALEATFTSPAGTTRTVRGFWDGGRTWRVRFSPGETGDWTYSTRAEPEGDTGLHARQGRFTVRPNAGTTRFERHGPVRVASARTYLEHADGTPFFWLADTAWNGPLLSTPDEWQHNIDVRTRQRFTAVQWVATEWRASPDGDRLGERAFTGRDRIAVNPAFFQRLDEKAVALNRAGLLNVPVLLWAISGGSNPAVNPGVSLPEDQAIKLTEYMVARWQGYDVVWIPAGDGDYRGERAERWKRIGRAVFGDAEHAPVVMHPGGMHWILPEFQNEPWVDIHGYQSGHGVDERALRWMIEGPPSTDWTRAPYRPFINLEPPYEHHVAYQTKRPMTPAEVRRAVYWTLLGAPVAGTSYGGHGVWGWDDGTRPPTDHPGSGTPLPWRQALEMPAANHMGIVADLFTSFDFWRLRPAPQTLVEQPGHTAPERFTAAAAADRDLLVVYTPEPVRVAVAAAALPGDRAVWFDPRTGARSPARGIQSGTTTAFEPPGAGDWVLVVTR